MPKGGRKLPKVSEETKRCLTHGLVIHSCVCSCCSGLEFPGDVSRVYEADRTLWIGGLKSTEKEENSSPAEAVLMARVAVSYHHPQNQEVSGLVSSASRDTDPTARDLGGCYPHLGWCDGPVSLSPTVPCTE